MDGSTREKGNQALQHGLPRTEDLCNHMYSTKFSLNQATNRFYDCSKTRLQALEMVYRSPGSQNIREATKSHTVN